MIINDKKINQLLQEDIFRHYYYKTYQNTNYDLFKELNDQNKIAFLINLYLYVADIHNNEDSNNEAKQLKTLKQNGVNDISDESEKVRENLSKIYQRYQLPKAELFYDEMIENFNFKENKDTLELMWSPSQIIHNRSLSYFKINFEQIKDNNQNIILNNTNCLYFIDNCLEVKLNFNISLLKSQRNDIIIEEINHNKLKEDSRRKPVKCNVSQMNYNPLLWFKKFKKQGYKYKPQQQNMFFDDISPSRGMSLLSNFSKQKVKACKNQYHILNQSYSHTSTAFLININERIEKVLKQLECPVESQITLTHNDSLQIRQTIIEFLKQRQSAQRNNSLTSSILNEDKYKSISNITNLFKEKLNNLHTQINQIYNYKEEDFIDKETYNAVSIEINNKYHQLTF